MLDAAAGRTEENSHVLVLAGGHFKDLRELWIFPMVWPLMPFHTTGAALQPAATAAHSA